MLCKHCGYENLDDFNFCAMCGNTFSDSLTKPNVSATKNINNVVEKEKSKKEVPVILRILLCIFYFCIFAVLEAGLKKAGFNGLFFSMIYGAIQFGGIALIWTWKR